MNNISSESITKKLQSRLRTQRRIFNFDNDQILVLPILEHLVLMESILKIKFYISEKGDFVTLKDIKQIKPLSNGDIYIETNNNEIFPLFSRKMNGEFICVKKKKFSFKDLTIDHTPSIQIVLFSMFLKKSNNFLILTNFCKSLKLEKLTLNDIKAKGFKKNVEAKLNNMEFSEKNKVLQAYKTIFNQIIIRKMKSTGSQNEKYKFLQCSTFEKRLFLDD